ncbi:retron system putative HNH endonuclease [Herbaspirillum huttiense]|uniref:retron system putative HNH endonuclease n=1 Tax=Herbaspirillum huttiense TaxID=863372 RepID=UPI0031DE316B
MGNYQHGQHNWNDVTAADKQEIWRALDAMQGQRCAYCEADISHGERHIEHFRQKGRDATQTFAWRNLFGSCNCEDTCGKYKDKQPVYAPAALIKPDDEDPEYFLRFHSDGTISMCSGISTAEQQRASETRRLFNLDAGALRWRRYAAAIGYLETVEEIAQLAATDPDLAATYLANEIAITAHLPFATAIKHTLQNRSAG